MQFNRGLSLIVYRGLSLIVSFLKNGVTINLDTRYTKAYMADKDILPITSGTRADMLSLERQRTLSNPGPYNNESWAVKVKNAKGAP